MLFGKPIIKAIVHSASRKSKKSYLNLGSGKGPLTKEEERDYLFDQENLQSDSFNIDVKDYSSFKPKQSKLLSI